MFIKENTVLVLIDVQERLIPVIHEKEELVGNLQKLITGMKILGVPIIWNEQYPKGLGATVPELSSLLTEQTPVEKVCFSCCQNESFTKALAESGRQQVIVCGIEAHICVYQTVMELKTKGYEVEVVADGVSSRQAYNKEIALDKLRSNEVGLTSTEMILFELIQVAQGDAFKKISRLVR